MRTFHYTRTERPDEKGETVTFSYWYAPELDCTALKEAAEWRQKDGKVTHRSERVGISLVPGEPDPALFQVPADYREMPPSAVQREIIERTTNRPTESTVLDNLQRLDTRYYDAQKLKP